MSLIERYKKRNHTYRNRILLSIVVAQLLAIGVFKFWPDQKEKERVYQVDDSQEVALIDEMEITVQQSSPPAPPKPRIPTPVPDDEIIEEELEFESELNLLELPVTEPGQGTALRGDKESIVSNPQLPPTVVKIVEATTPENVPSDLKGRLEFIVNFLVDKNGEVEEASIVEIRKYDNNGSYETMPFIKHGLMDAVLEAALRWKFRPARHQGDSVKSFTKQRFNY